MPKVLDDVFSLGLDVVADAGLRLVIELSGYRDSLKATTAGVFPQSQASLSFVGTLPR